jgi:hypothetical protein
MQLKFLLSRFMFVFDVLGLSDKFPAVIFKYICVPYAPIP